jgi:hypothetical protein
MLTAAGRRFPVLDRFEDCFADLRLDMIFTPALQ